MTPTLVAISVSFLLSRLLNRRPGGPLCWMLAFSTTPHHQRVSKLTDFLSSPSYIIVQSPTQYIPMTGHRDMSLPPSLECHVCSSSAEITVMQFTGHSLPVHPSVSVPWDFTLCHIVSEARLRRWNMQLPRLWNGMSSRVEGQYTTQVYQKVQLLLLRITEHQTPISTLYF